MPTSRSDEPQIPRKDRVILRERLKTLFVERKLSGRKVEETLNLGGGTLSKIYAGKMRLTHKVLQGLADLLRVSANTIVEGTVFEHLLCSAVPTPEGPAAEQFAAEIDRIRGDVHAKDATIATLRADLASCQVQLAESLRQEKRHASDAQAARQAANESRKAAQKADDERSATEERVRDLGEKLATEQARSRATSEQAEGWRRKFIERQERVGQLEAYCKTLLVKVGRAEEAKTSAAIGAGLLAFVAGTIMSKDS